MCVKMKKYFYLDTPEYSGISFPDVATPLGEQLIKFHDNVMFIVVFMTILVG